LATLGGGGTVPKFMVGMLSGSSVILTMNQC
jgi:hypothetical protein